MRLTGFGVVCNYENSSEVSGLGLFSTRDEAVEELVAITKSECSDVDEDEIRYDEIYIDESNQRIFGIIQFN